MNWWIDVLLFDEHFHIHNIEERKNNVQLKGLISKTKLFFDTQFNLSYLIVVQIFKILGLVVTEKSLMKTSIIITSERER